MRWEFAHPARRELPWMQGDLQPAKSEVILTYLKSYQHMGRAKVECVANCK